MSHYRVLTSVSLLIIAVASLGGSPVPAAGTSPGKAMLIGIETYDVEDLKLRFVGNDLGALFDALGRCKFECAKICDSAVDFGDANTSERDAMQHAIGNWIGGMQPTDTAFLYFSGHGIVGSDGKLYLALTDCNVNNAEKVGLPAAWLRQQLKRCPARCKILAIDACHAGAGQRSSKGFATTKAVVKELGTLSDVILLASCAEQQQSYLWEDKRYSLFTYWLSKGLLGQADAGLDGRVTLNELNDFVRNSVQKTSIHLSKLHPSIKEQTPVFLVSDGNVALPEFQPRPMKWNYYLDDVADRLDTLIRQIDVDSASSGKPVVGLCDWTSGNYAERDLRMRFGVVTRSVVAELEKRLRAKAGDHYMIWSQDVMRRVLEGRGLSPENIESLGIERVELNGRRLTTLIDGNLKARAGCMMHVRVDLRDLRDVQTHTTGGFAHLTLDEWLELGLSVDITEVEAEGRDESHFISVLDNAAASQPHPLDDKRREKAGMDEFPFDLTIEVRGSGGVWRVRPFDFARDPNKCIVTFKRGEVYRIGVKSKYANENGAFARILVDGLNTLPQMAAPSAKGISVEPTASGSVVQPVRLRLEELATRIDSAERAVEWRTAPHVRLCEARPWFLPPGFAGAIPGYACGTREKEIAYREFQVIDAPQSLAARRGYTEDVGIISASFYEPVPGRGRFQAGTRRGELVEKEFDRYEGGYKPGPLLGVVHIHYVGEE